MLIFPEGTCTNQKAIITFKNGAFYPGLPIQPVVVRYRWKWVLGDTYPLMHAKVVICTHDETVYMYTHTCDCVRVTPNRCACQWNSQDMTSWATLLKGTHNCCSTLSIMHIVTLTDEHILPLSLTNRYLDPSFPAVSPKIIRLTLRVMCQVYNSMEVCGLLHASCCFVLYVCYLYTQEWASVIHV